MAIMLQALRERIARMEGFSPPQTARHCPTGWGGVDAALPGGGLLLGALHEIHSPDPADGAAAGFALRMLRRCLAMTPGRAALWASCRCDLFAPGLHAAGIDPGRLIQARCRDSSEVIFAAEESIQSKSLSIIFGEITEVDFSISRRLQLACAESASTLILLRPARFGAEPSAAVTRWRAECVPSGWALTLFRSRGGRPGHWRMPPEEEEAHVDA